MENKQFMIYAYSSPTDGRWFIDKVLFRQKDFRTKKRYREYRNCGFNTLMLQANDPYCGEPFKKSSVKRDMDRARAAGIERIILYDKRIAPYSEIEGGIVGEGKPFADEQTLDNFVRMCLSDYRKEPGFYGIMLVDEPRWRQLPSVGEMTRAIKRVAPEVFVQCNILPLYHGCNTQYAEHGAEMTTEEAFRAYLEDYLDRTQAEYLLYDSYPMREEPEKGFFLLRFHLPGLQIAAEVTKARKIPFYFVAQTTAYLVHMRQRFRACNEADMRWQINCLLAFGIKSFSYYTYWRKQDNYTQGGFHPDGTQFICNDGRRAPLYEVMKRIHAEMQRLAPFLLDCEWERATRFSAGEPPEFLAGMRETEIPDLERVGAEGEYALVATELLHKPSGRTVVAFFNAADPRGPHPEAVRIAPRFRKKALSRFGLKSENGPVPPCADLEAGEAVFYVLEKE